MTKLHICKINISSDNILVPYTHYSDTHYIRNLSRSFAVKYYQYNDSSSNIKCVEMTIHPYISMHPNHCMIYPSRLKSIVVLKRIIKIYIPSSPVPSSSWLSASKTITTFVLDPAILSHFPISLISKESDVGICISKS